MWFHPKVKTKPEWYTDIPLYVTSTQEGLRGQGPYGWRKTIDGVRIHKI